jgi:hypothetical protein
MTNNPFIILFMKKIVKGRVVHILAHACGGA